MPYNHFIKNDGYECPTLTVEKAYGCYIEDSVGNKYIDTTVGNGTHILGHASLIVNDAISEQINNGILYTTPNNTAYDVAELISYAYSTLESVIFCNSGSEATMRAARIARSYTNKDKIAIFSGAWHGGNELFMYDHDYSSNDLTTRHKSSGIPDSFLRNVIVLPYNDEKAFDIINDNKDELAMVIVEPSQGSNPRDDMGDYLRKLRKATQENEVLLCFDEIITGFRVSYGGCQEYYNIDADIVTFGKTVGGGLPIGVLAGKREIFKIISGGDNLPVFMGGTFSANPLVMRVSKALLSYLYSNQSYVYKDLKKKGGHLKDKFNNHCKTNDIDAQMMGIGSMLRVMHSRQFIKSRRERDRLETDAARIDGFYQNLLGDGVFVNSNKIMFISLSHTDDIVDRLLYLLVENIR